MSGAWGRGPPKIEAPPPGAAVNLEALRCPCRDVCQHDDVFGAPELFEHLQLYHLALVQPLSEAPLEPSEDELGDLALACAKLWDLDKNRLTPGEDYTLNVQGGKKAYWNDDSADDPLFSFVNDEVFKRPTFRAFFALLDNYERETGTAEVVTSSEQRENYHFLEEILNTKPMAYAHKYLVAKGLSPANETQFKRQLYTLWFKLYRRSTSNDSSGFEHVFVGEVKNGKVSGMHNWMQLYIEEQRGNLDYKGWIYPRKRSGEGADETDQVMTIQFAWGGEVKTVSTSFIGVSPEFEMALYTMCFLSHSEETEVELGDYQVTVKTYKIGRDMIGTAFPQCSE